jgi:7-carboxy-7-deazaguanine synthase
MMSLDQVLEQVQSQSLLHVVLTGGEPMLFEEIVPLAEKLRELGKVITIETAGTIDRKLPCDLMSISPKLAHSAPDDLAWRTRHNERRYQPDVLRSLVANYNYQLKFVVDPEDTDGVKEIEAVLADIGQVDPGRVMLMPEGRDTTQLWRKAKSLVPIVMARNWRVISRMQIDLFGDTKGT